MPLSKASFERMVLQEGRPVTLVRRGPPYYEVTDILAKVTRARNSPEIDDISGGMVEDTFMITCTTQELTAAAFPLPPVTTDRVQFDEEYHLIRAVYPLYLATVLVGYKLQVKG